MSAGIKVYNPDGTLQFDTTKRVLRFLTVLSSGTTNGSANVPDLNQGTGVTVVGPSSEGGNKPSVSISGTTVSWNWGAIPPGSRENNNIDVLVF